MIEQWNDEPEPTHYEDDTSPDAEIESRPRLYRVVVSHIFPPIPLRGFDYAVYVDGEEERARYGYGPTIADAVSDFCDIEAEDTEFGPYPPLLVDSLALEIDDYFTFAIIHDGSNG